ncbi:MAG: hypothetical protein AAGJ93_00495 [Bacteroidota bacterium]
MKPVFTLLFLLPFLFQCNRTTYTSTTFPADYLAFGEGGGYSGAINTYFLLPNGQIFQSKGLTADTLAYAQMSKKSANQLIDRFNSLGLDTLNFDHPGNQYQFVEKHTQDKVLRLCMGDMQTAAPAALSSFYQALSESLKAVVPETADQ